MLKFMRLKWLYFMISLAVILPGVFSLVFFGLRPSIAFTGGTLWEIQVSSEKFSLASTAVRNVFEAKNLPAEVQTSESDRLLIKNNSIDGPQKTDLAAALKKETREF